MSGDRLLTRATVNCKVCGVRYLRDDDIGSTRIVSVVSKPYTTALEPYYDVVYRDNYYCRDCTPYVLEGRLARILLMRKAKYLVLDATGWHHKAPIKLLLNPILRAIQFWTYKPYVIVSEVTMGPHDEPSFIRYSLIRYPRR